jgi:hypothetical protein
MKRFETTSSAIVFIQWPFERFVHTHTVRADSHLVSPKGEFKKLGLAGSMSTAAANLHHSAFFSFLTILAAVFAVGFWGTITSGMRALTWFVSHFYFLPITVRCYLVHSDARTVVSEGQGSVQETMGLL